MPPRKPRKQKQNNKNAQDIEQLNKEQNKNDFEQVLEAQLNDINDDNNNQLNLLKKKIQKQKPSRKTQNNKQFKLDIQKSNGKKKESQSIEKEIIQDVLPECKIPPVQNFVETAGFKQINGKKEEIKEDEEDFPQFYQSIPKKGKKYIKKVKKDQANQFDLLPPISDLDEEQFDENKKAEKKKQKGQKKIQKQERKEKQSNKKVKKQGSSEEKNGEGQKQNAHKIDELYPSLLQSFCQQPLPLPDAQGNYHINFFQRQSRQRIQEQLEQSNQQINQLIESYPQFFQNQPSYQNYMNRFNQLEFPGFVAFQTRPITNLEQNQQYYTKAKNPSELINNYDPNEPYMKIIVQKANCNDIQNEEHFLTQRGLVGSLKNTVCEDIVIGRQLSLVNQTHPNDIVLPANDRAISRIHCKINYKDGFKNRLGLKNKTKIIDQFVTFLMNGHPRLGAFSPFRNLPKHLFAKIWEYHKAPKKFYIADIGSIFGTFMKIKQNYVYMLQKGQNFLIGADIQFWISDATKSMGYLTEEQINNEKFQKYLAGLQKLSLVKFHGFPIQIENKINILAEDITSPENQPEFNTEGYPMLKVDLSQAPNGNHSRQFKP